jgi:hypothetical protein
MAKSRTWSKRHNPVEPSSSASVHVASHFEIQVRRGNEER